MTMEQSSYDIQSPLTALQVIMRPSRDVVADR